MQVLVSLIRKGQEPQDVLIRVEEEATVADLAGSLQRAAGGRPAARLLAAMARQQGGRPQQAVAAAPPAAAPLAATPSLWLDGWRADPAAPVGPLLRDGMRISLDDEVGPLLRSAEPTGQYELRVVGGPGSGRVARLSVGAATVGSAPTCSVPVADPALPPTAVRIGIDIHGTAKLTPQAGLPAFLNDEPVTERTVWPLGGMLAVGESLLVLDRPTEPDAHLAPTGEGGLAYNRPPRLLPVHQRPRVHVPDEPSRGDGSRLNYITALVPMIFGFTMFMVFDSVYMLLFCFMSPLMMIGQYLQSKQDTGKKYKKSVRQYREEMIQYARAINMYARQDQTIRREAAPDATEILLFATGPRRRLWERRLTDPDVLRLRVGFAAQRAEFDVVLSGRAKARTLEPPEPPTLPNIPVTVALPELGVVGISGDRPRALSTARWLAVQAATLHSPRDVSLVVISSAQDAASVWEWAHWLPHTAPQQGQPCVSLVASESEPIGRRVNELLAELGRRQAMGQGGGFGAPKLRPEPFIVVLLDGARLLRRMPGVPQLLQEGPAVGILAICIDEDERLLPEECQAVVSWSPYSQTRVQLRGSGLETVGEVLADQVPTAWCDRVARSLAPVRDVSRDDADAAIPTSARLLTLLNMPNPSGEDIERIWRAGGQSTGAPIGVTADGPYVLDIKRDGPHGLVAGTTGAGKSELLQSIIASLAVANHPESLNFVLIDYKGGSAFQDCANLPHTVGMVSDLDAHLTERALASLAAELHRREEILFRTGNKDIEDYNDDRKQRRELVPMPRLMIVIDEFASLVAELPDFVAGLVDIARRGRSLGVHLILATQRPAGVVSADIRANTNLRIALRVTNAAESQDVIDAPDSGAIAKSTPGRMFVRSGAQNLVGVQSARIGGRRPRQDAAGPKADLAPMSWAAYARPLPRRQEAEDDGSMVTDLAVLVEAICEGSRRMGFGEPHRPWLEPLPEKVVLDELPAAPGAAESPAADGAARDVAPLAFGVTDMPSEQARVPLSLDLVRGDHTLIVGGPRSGRSTALRTVAGAIARHTAPQDVHIYAIDCGSNALLPLVGLPHTGAVVTREQPDRVRRLLDRLRGEISRRQELLAERGASSAAEQRATASPQDRLPWIVVMVDAWEGFVSAFEKYNYGQLIEAMQLIFREGSAIGLKAVVTSDRRGLTGQMSSAFANKLVLRLADPNDYAAAGLRARDIPGEMPSGRALQAATDGMMESQLALLTEEDSGQAQVAALQEIGRQAQARTPELRGAQRPMRVDALPTKIAMKDALKLAPSFTPPSKLWAMLGVGGDELHPMGVNLEEHGPGFVIAGPPKSGRSTTLAGAAQSLLRNGVPIVIITPRRSPLRQMEGADGVLAVLGGDASKNELQELLEPVKKKQYAVVVDDAELVYDTALDKPLEEVLKTGMDGEHALVAAGTIDSLSSQYRGFAATARKSRNGMLLRPRNPAEGELFGVRLPANSGAGPVGNGILVMGGTLIPIQSAMLD